MAKKPPGSKGQEILIDRLHKLNIPPGPLRDRWSEIYGRWKDPAQKSSVTSEELQKLRTDIDNARASKAKKPSE